ncbi:MAG: hypothetical protein NTV01_21990 [Bacteroidia bacterium]|nr:hypothetical protein [Bacteroidia bacterium]
MKNLDDFYILLQKQVAQLGREPSLESLNALDLNNYPYSVEVDKLFLSYFKTLPNHLGIRDIHIENAHYWFLEKYEDQIWNFHVPGWSTEESESRFSDVYYCLFDDLIIHFGFLREYISLYWKKRSKAQSQADPIEHPMPTLFINNRHNSLTTKTSVRMRLANNFHQVLGDLFGDWSTSCAGDGKTCPFVPIGTEISN